ncbi:hypothetical protein [Salinibaculum rarum]|uniref:hypothetical protein n=1 Tax=Salinibaculum rarum TaxID=3058903 RepID=UPI00265EE97A|nr:hypothetical protein [Salinibaculum sp. KK48]
MFQTSAGYLAGRDRLPTSLRAVLGYYADSGVFDYRSLQLQRRIDDATDAIVADAFAAVEEAIAEEFDREFVEFSYDTKLVLPAELTLGYLYRQLEEPEYDDAEAVTQLVIEALIDGDMRDAVNDDEFDDFEVDFPVDESDRRRVAEVAQATLEARVTAQFESYPDAVRDAYDWAVDISERHQDEDDHFRALMAAAQGENTSHTPAEARERIREEYKDADFADPPAIFDEELDLPYFKTQYDRVGVIYSGMVEMYREAGLPVEEAFEKSIVLAIIGAQIWLDDIDDFQADMEGGQLTPVTAEYLLADDDATAATRAVDISEQYLDLAKAHATTVDSTLTGIATEYIYRSGDPSVLPR